LNEKGERKESGGSKKWCFVPITPRGRSRRGPGGAEGGRTSSRWGVERGPRKRNTWRRQKDSKKDLKR